MLQLELEYSFQQEKMAEVYSLLKQKEIEIMRLEHRYRELQGLHEEKRKTESRKEERFSETQKEYREAKKRNANESRGKNILNLYNYKIILFIFVKHIGQRLNGFIF